MSGFLINNTEDARYPPGTIIHYSCALTSSTSLQGWLFCDGATYNASTYPDLFSAIGYRYGSSGSTFSVPNFQNYYAIGISGEPISSATRGSNNVNLDNNHLASHSHTGTSGAGGGHTHNFESKKQSYSQGYNWDNRGGENSPDYEFRMWGENKFGAGGDAGTGNANNNHAHNISTSGSAYGGSNPVSVMPNYTALLFIIKT
jgi:microcystin-dependent protein